VNENTNGLVRQYFPKKSEFSQVTDKQVKQVEERLNHRPRKTLGYRTPPEVFFKLPPGDAPRLFQMRLELVFFKAWLT
jgi:IS30 family transposase